MVVVIIYCQNVIFIRKIFENLSTLSYKSSIVFCGYNTIFRYMYLHGLQHYYSRQSLFFWCEQKVLLINVFVEKNFLFVFSSSNHCMEWNYVPKSVQTFNESLKAVAKKIFWNVSFNLINNMKTKELNLCSIWR